ncbi:putative solute carrier family 35 member SLC35F1/F2/F6 [Helianthus annuus]|nr:putative solute carrier family 35 member SLC35F1/F2/F6 [Helianthus annuus]KAJ0687369.1 putative solute carrier family 35 member SLC35F1/F2/F6 [Helianthus annuus]KAJ0872843.1 putative solute carrier family 35 member SLC35F1/F2/F6 [Helianthus annuus]KAJ0877254.1 putative solute carrier family 35 member SLC35F1/F2/F6 [Helianthus annuus]
MCSFSLFYYMSLVSRVSLEALPLSLGIEVRCAYISPSPDPTNSFAVCGIYQTSGSTLFNLSLLTTDMWAVVIRIFFYQQQVQWLYYVSFAVVGVGLLIYSKK